MSLINSLNDSNIWEEFLSHKKENSKLPEKIIQQYEIFIKEKKYQNLSTRIINNDYKFSTPKKVIISKMGKPKKRIIYTYNEEETYILKLINYLLYKYDFLFSPNLYSFRKNSGVKKAIYDITNYKDIDKMYGYKVDISNYFNSIPISNLLQTLKNDLNDDCLFNLIESLLANNKVQYNGTIITENKGIMAGVPISAFLANYYLKDLDYLFYNKNILYARYADDIILFTENYDTLIQSSQLIKDFIKNKGLTINSNKEFYYQPGDKFEFLGFSYYHKVIDLNDNSLKKIKGKIRRTARGLRRWKIKKQASDEVTLKAMNRKFNRKFYGKKENELTWKYWFFPTINTTNTLKIIDNYMQAWERYIITGCHNKKNIIKVPYSFLKKCNYKSLVHEYYQEKEKNILIKKK